MSTNVIAEKKRLRAHFLAQRAAIPAAEKAALDAALCREIAAHPAFAACETLLCFFPVRGEPDFTALYELARERGVKTAFPICTGVQMRFHIVAHEREMETGRFGIPTPPKDAPLAPLNARTLCLVPALAASGKGERLGYGGGFYDRFLANFKGTSMLPIYSTFTCDTLPREDTDLAVSIILTEKGVLLQNG